MWNLEVTLSEYRELLMHADDEWWHRMYLYIHCNKNTFENFNSTIDYYPILLNGLVVRSFPHPYVLDRKLKGIQSSEAGLKVLALKKMPQNMQFHVQGFFYLFKI